MRFNKKILKVIKNFFHADKTQIVLLFGFLSINIISKKTISTFSIEN